MSIQNSFTRSYSEARAQFRVLADKADASISSLLVKRHSPTGAEEQVTGPSGEDLTIDIAWIGDTHPQRAFIHSSGTHGVEGFAGSAIQCDWFANRVKAAKDGSAIVFIHCINPYGMAWLRRCNENNVDLNRNFAEFPRRGKESSAYAKLDRFLNPRTTPSGDMAFYLAALGLMARYGFGRLQQVVAGGQYEYDRGLFFGGRALESGPIMLRDFLLPRFREVERLVAIDVHTGLGNYGVDTLLVDSSLSQRSVAGSAARVQKPQMKGVAYHVEGPLYNLYQWTAPKAERIFAFQEFGTYSALRVLQALRLENYWHQQNVGISHAAKEKLLSIFAPKDRAWRDQVIARGSTAIDHGLTLLH